MSRQPAASRGPPEIPPEVTPPRLAVDSLVPARRVLRNSATAAWCVRPVSWVLDAILILAGRFYYDFPR